MKAQFSLGFLVLIGGGFAAVQPPVAWPIVKRTVTLTLTVAPQTFAPIPPQPPTPPVTIVVGTHVQFTTAFDPAFYKSITVVWQKDGRFAGNGAIYDVASANPSDSGIYSAFVTTVDAQDRRYEFLPQSAAVLVTNEGQRLLNTSTRAHIDPANPVIVHGFVLEPAPTPTLLLIRAVGPTLGRFGIGDPLGHPMLKVFDGAGREQDPDPTHFQPGGVLPSVEDSTGRVGAFPLLPGAADVAVLYYLPSGAYTASVNSADGGSGTVLLEIYQVPLSAPLRWLR